MSMILHCSKVSKGAEVVGWVVIYWPYRQRDFGSWFYFLGFAPPSLYSESSHKAVREGFFETSSSNLYPAKGSHKAVRGANVDVPTTRWGVKPLLPSPIYPYPL